MLLLLVTLQLGDFILARQERRLVVHKFPYHKLVLPAVQPELLHHLEEEGYGEQAVLLIFVHQQGRLGHHHVRQLLVLGVPILVEHPRHHDEEGGKVLRPDDKVLLAHQVGQATDEQAPRGFAFDGLQLSLEVVVSSRLALEVSVDLRHLLADDFSDALEGLLDGVLGHVPLKPGQVGL
uniref:Putative secreted protein n=1 Tax=Ixodes ricinus TaxID=34613 RepID=A0A6B0UYS5_IXORI